MLHCKFSVCQGKQIPTTAPIATEVVPLPKSPVWQKAALLTTGGPGPSGTGKPCCQLSGSPESRGAGASICYFQDWQNMRAGAGKEPGRWELHKKSFLKNPSLPLSALTALRLGHRSESCWGGETALLQPRYGGKSCNLMNFPCSPPNADLRIERERQSIKTNRNSVSLQMTLPGGRFRRRSGVVSGWELGDAGKGGVGRSSWQRCLCLPRTSGSSAWRRAEQQPEPGCCLLKWLSNA